MSGFIPYGTAVPSLTRSEFSWSGLTFGGAGPLPMQPTPGLTGVDLAPINTGDAQRPLEGGEFIGVDVMRGRDIVLDFLSPHQSRLAQSPTATDLAALASERRAFASAMAAKGVRATPLFIADDTGAVFAVMARPRAWAAPKTQEEWMTGAGRYHAAFHATDWRLYAAPTKRTTISDAASGTLGTCVNNGNVEMRPLLTITCEGAASVVKGAGPVTVQNHTLGVNWQYSSDIAPGDHITVDLDFRTCTYYPAGGAPYSVEHFVNLNSTWWNFPPGTNSVELLFGTVDAGNGHVDIDYADAYAGI
jgi:hypothetical protein